MKNKENQMKLYLPSLSINESVARSAVAVFVAQLNPTIEEISDIKCAVSEAVTNAIVHGYKYEMGEIYIGVKYNKERSVLIEIKDKGCGIEDVTLAMTPTGSAITSGTTFTCSLPQTRQTTCRYFRCSVPLQGMILMAFGITSSP